MGSERKKILIVIQLHIAHNELYKLRYMYKDICKDRYEQSDIVENQINFL